MPKTTRTIITLIFIFYANKAYTQEDQLVKDIIESFAENLPEDYDLSELTERLIYYKKHPIDLNNTNVQVLKELVFLSPLQISNFFNHLKSNGKLLDVLELQGIAGFDLQTINLLLPFILLKVPVELSGLHFADLYLKGNNELILRYGRLFQTQKGFKDLPGSRYLGTPDKLLLRYKYNYSDIVSASLVAEKDAGEYFLRGKAGTDHLSANVTFYKLGRVKKLVLGDYSLQFGQGLTLWSGFAFGKGPDVTSVAAKDSGLRPYSSSNEASFFRGASATVTLFKNIDLTPFISFRKLDASLKVISNDISTLQNINISGLHRTKTELKNQKNLGQLVYGGNLQYNSNNLNIGFTGYQSGYQHEFITGTQLYNKYGFTGTKLVNSGLYYNYTFKNIYFYGEASHSFNSGWAIVNGAMASLSPQISAVVLYRNYDRDFHNFFGNGVGEGTEVNNEKGLYSGLNYTPDKRWTFSVYGDYFKFPWLKYRVDSTSSGYEILGQATYTPTKTFKISVRLKQEIKQQNPDADSSYPYLEQVNKESLRFTCSWQFNKKFSFQQRIEISHYQKGMSSNETGCLIYQDIGYNPLSTKLSAGMRFAYFNTPSYNSRIYAYEDDVLYGAGSGAYSGKGVRVFINTRYRLTGRTDLWARYATYLYRGIQTIGTGLDEITGSKKSDIKLQLRYQF